MSSDPMKVGDIHKPDIHGDNLPWETRLVNETNTAFSSMDYGPNNWILMQVPSSTFWGRGGLVVRSRPRDRRVAGSKPDSTEDPPCMGPVAR
ncbi:hypothetical protein AVEN_61680-1 [Araneus ventricosus]|uniref:Uncharacterized protein n=1 Tax=Araneus ventricosus TaxID=182803 RepID=A0A4Y2VBX6_ARAVE|nr:hypothetical protein AVEN_242294-1 [Araneus ventricosus]GBO22600.1 hypothetical protein AVEN_61680-1 [Araneus ventricosus]